MSKTTGGRSHTGGKRESPSARRPQPSSPTLTIPHAFLPVALVLLLCIPCVSLGFFWDDYYYLTRGQAEATTYLLPQAGAMSYRPIPEGLYFLGLLVLSPITRNAGHVFNLILIGASVFLLVRLVSRLSSPRAGILSGIVFATLAPVPTVVAWTSCAPDAFALFFILAALNMRHSGHNWGAFAAAALALFSKESALLVFPVLIFWDWLVGRKPQRLILNLVLYGALALIWTLVHPGFRSLMNHGFQSGGTGYLGLEQPQRWVSYFVQYLATTFNLPITGPTTPWPEEIAPFGVVALLVAVAWFWATRRSRLQKATVGNLPLNRATWLALSIAIPLLVLPSVLVRRWNPYFVCLPAIGIALLAGILLARASVRLAVIVLAAYITFGIWSRGMEVPGGLVFTEQDCISASQAAKKVEHGFRSQRPSLPVGSQALVSVTTTGMLGIYGILIDGQALRIWYGDRQLATRLPERRRPGAPADHLFRVYYDLDVAEIDPAHQGAFPSADYEVSNVGYEHWLDDRRTIRSYARGLAASGETDRAVDILKGIAVTDSGQIGQYDLRLAAMALLADQRGAEAYRLLDGMTPFAKGRALDLIAKLLREPTESATFDSCAFEAFGLSRTDPEAIRYLRSKVSR